MHDAFNTKNCTLKYAPGPHHRGSCSMKAVGFNPQQCKTKTHTLTEEWNEKWKQRGGSSPYITPSKNTLPFPCKSEHISDNINLKKKRCPRLAKATSVQCAFNVTVHFVSQKGAFPGFIWLFISFPRSGMWLARW